MFTTNKDKTIWQKEIVQLSVLFLVQLTYIKKKSIITFFTCPQYAEQTAVLQPQLVFQSIVFVTAVATLLVVQVILSWYTERKLKLPNCQFVSFYVTEYIP